MVGRVMMIGLSLAVASFGRSEDENNGGTAGAGGSAGSGGAPQVIPPACDNTDDLAAIESGEPAPVGRPAWPLCGPAHAG